jgi:4-hydroxy-3-methylbut-2-en-1-yl diphosphate reductase
MRAMSDHTRQRSEISSHFSEEAFAPGQIIRKGMGHKDEIKSDISRDYYSEIIHKIEQNGYVHKKNGLTFHLATSFGFCYGVDRSLDLAYETQHHFPGKRVFLTTEIIHNPNANNNLRKMGIHFLSGPYNDEYGFDDVTEDDVVILPAFGTDVDTLTQLKKKGCILVDTICGSVLNVWNRVESYARDEFTSIIHGKYYHEESVATSSRVLEYKGGHYLIVFSEDQAEEVIRYMLKGGDKKDFLGTFHKACSPGFDPDEHLDRVGLANQTTMLSSESLAIAERFRQTMIKKFGKDTLDQHFRNFDTICSATEDRQQAVLQLKDRSLDLMLVIGGYNSSNTNHLRKISGELTTAYHIEDADCILSANEIRHKPYGQWETIVTRDWLPQETANIGITSGASTPNQVMGKVIEKILSF